MLYYFLTIWLVYFSSLYAANKQQIEIKIINNHNSCNSKYQEINIRLGKSSVYSVYLQKEELSIPDSIHQTENVTCPVVISIKDVNISKTLLFYPEEYEWSVLLKLFTYFADYRNLNFENDEQNFIGRMLLESKVSRVTRVLQTYLNNYIEQKRQKALLPLIYSILKTDELSDIQLYLFHALFDAKIIGSLQSDLKRGGKNNEGSFSKTALWETVILLGLKNPRVEVRKHILEKLLSSSHKIKISHRTLLPQLEQEKTNMMKKLIISLLFQVGTKQEIQFLFKKFWEYPLELKVHIISSVKDERLVDELVSICHNIVYNNKMIVSTDKNLVLRAGLEQLGKIQSKKQIGFLKDCVLNTNFTWDIRHAAITSLYELGYNEAIPVFIMMLTDELEGMRQHAVQFLGEFRSKIAYEAIEERLKNDPSGVVQGLAASALYKIDRKRAIALFKQIIRSKNKRSIFLQNVVKLHLIENGEHIGIKPILRFLNSENEYPYSLENKLAKATAIEILQKYGDEKCIPVLIDLINHEPDAEIIYVADKALAELLGVSPSVDITNQTDANALNRLIDFWNDFWQRNKDKIRIKRLKDGVKNISAEKIFTPNSSGKIKSIFLKISFTNYYGEKIIPTGIFSVKLLSKAETAVLYEIKLPQNEEKLAKSKGIHLDMNRKTLTVYLFDMLGDDVQTNKHLKKTSTYRILLTLRTKEKEIIKTIDL